MQMIIYSVTVSISKDVEKSWLNWMKEIHILDVLKTGYFFEYEFQKLLIPDSGEEESTYVINYRTDSLDKYQNYSLKEAPRLQKEHYDKFFGKFKASRLIYRLIEK